MGGQNSKCPMGIEGLDDVLGGGLPRNRIYLIQGDPGAGKTTLALQFLLAGARLREHSLYITLSETKEELAMVGESHGWDLSQIHLFELSSMAESLKGETENTFFHPSEVELNRTKSRCRLSSYEARAKSSQETPGSGAAGQP